MYAEITDSMIDSICNNKIIALFPKYYYNIIIETCHFILFSYNVYNLHNGINRIYFKYTRQTLCKLCRHLLLPAMGPDYRVLGKPAIRTTLDGWQCSP